MGEHKVNTTACERILTDSQIENFKEVIKYRYHYRLFVDDLPSATLLRDPENGVVHTDYFSGIPVGKMVYDEAGQRYRYILYNHWNINIDVQEVEDSLHRRIVGFTVEPRSYALDEIN